MDFWKDQFDELKADGVDFVPIGFNPCCTPQGKVFDSFTKEQMLSGKAVYPRSGYLFWRIENGLKMYIIKDRKDNDFTAETLLDNVKEELDYCSYQIDSPYGKEKVVAMADVDRVFKRWTQKYGEWEVRKC